MNTLRLCGQSWSRRYSYISLDGGVTWCLCVLKLMFWFMRIVSFYMQCTLTGGIESHAILNVILLRGYHCFAVASKDNRKNWDKLSIPCHVWLIFYKLEYWGIIIGFELTGSGCMLQNAVSRLQPPVRLPFLLPFSSPTYTKALWIPSYNVFHARDSAWRSDDPVQDPAEWSVI